MSFPFAAELFTIAPEIGRKKTQEEAEARRALGEIMSFATKLKTASGDAKASGATRYYLAAIFVFSGLSPLSAAQAEDIHHDPRFWVEAGVYLPNADTQIQLSLPDSDNGTSFSLEDD